MRTGPGAVADRLDAIRAGTSEELLGFSEWTPPWHPILLEWEVEILPVFACSNFQSEAREYAPGFITRNYELDEIEGELVLQADKGTVGRAANVYRGRSHLTFHATEQLTAKIAAYLERNPAPEGRDEDIIQASGILESSTFNSLAQALTGLNDALLMHRQSMQLPVADPLGFAEYQQFSSLVAEAVGTELGHAPEPLNDFNPIRTGVMKLLRLRLVDSFGQTHDLDSSKLIPATSLSVAHADHLVHLPPRLVQPAAVGFRLLADEERLGDTSAHPDTNPICSENND